MTWLCRPGALAELGHCGLVSSPGVRRHSVTPSLVWYCPGRPRQSRSFGLSGICVSAGTFSFDPPRSFGIGLESWRKDWKSSGLGFAQSRRYCFLSGHHSKEKQLGFSIVSILPLLWTAQVNPLASSPACSFPRPNCDVRKCLSPTRRLPWHLERTI